MQNMSYGSMILNPTISCLSYNISNYVFKASQTKDGLKLASHVHRPSKPSHPFHLQHPCLSLQQPPYLSPNPHHPLQVCQSMLPFSHIPVSLFKVRISSLFSHLDRTSWHTLSLAACKSSSEP